MGSSRFEGAIRPGVIDPLLRQYTRLAPRTFNAAVGAGDPLVAERLYDRIRRTGRRPALLVLELSPEHLAQRSLLLREQVLRQMTWADLPSYLPDTCLYTPVMRLLSSRLVPLYFYRYQLRKKAVTLLSPGTDRCLMPRPAATEDACPPPNLNDLPPPQPPLARVPGTPTVPPPTDHLTRWLKDYRLSPLISAALERLLARCRAEGTDVLLVGAFTMKGHRELYTPEIEKTYRAYVQHLTTKYGCRFVDLRDRLPDHGFGDSLHASDAGAKHFSGVLAREVLITLWRELHP
jgi:hypothetical protein